MSNHSTNSGFLPSSSRFSMSIQEPTINSPRRLSERDTASMRPRSWVERSSASASSFFASALASADMGFFRSISAPLSSEAACGKPIDQRQAVGFERIAGAVLLGPRQHLAAHEGEELFGQALRLARLHAPGPAGAGKGQCGAQHLLQQLLAVLVLAQQIADAVGQAAAPPALGFGPPDPAAEFGGFERRQMAGKGRVRGIEQMMALVEDDAADAAGRCFLFLGRGHAQRMVDGGLVQHQRVVGDDDRGIAARRAPSAR